MSQDPENPVRSELSISLPSLITKDNQSAGPLAKTLHLGKGPGLPYAHILTTSWHTLCRHQLDAFLGFSLQGEAHFAVVETIQLDIFQPPERAPNHTDVCILAHWLRMFSRLKILEFQNIALPHSACTSILVQIPRCNPNIQTIIMNDLPHDVSTYTKSLRPVESGEPTTSLQDIVDDVLGIIFEDLPNGSLISLSMVSRRFQLIALPIFLERHRIFSPYTTLVLEPSNFLHYNEFDRDALSGLLASVFIKSVDKLHCILPYTDHSYFTTFHLLRLRNFISHLDQCKEVKIEFDTRSDPFKYRQTYSRPLCRRWTAICTDLLKTIVATGCESLHISGGSSSLPIFKENNGPTRRAFSLLSAGMVLLGRTDSLGSLFDTCNLHHMKSRKILRGLNPRDGTLKTLSLHSRTVFGEVSFPRLDALLRSQTLITHFSYKAVFGFSLTNLAGIFPALTSFTLLGVDLPDGLAEFLRTVQKLRHIEIARQIHSVPSTKPVFTLPNLESITASSIFIPYLLSTNSGLPKLKKVTLVLAPFQTIPYAAPPEILNLVSKRLSQSSNPIDLELQLHIDKSAGNVLHRHEIDIDAIIKCIYPSWCSSPRGLSTVSIYDMGANPDTLSHIIPLLSRFPCLLHVQVWIGKSNADSLCPGDRYYQVLLTIQDKYPRLSTLEINGKPLSSYSTSTPAKSKGDTT